MAGAYVQFGPFSNGSPPGIQQSFLNPLETFLLSVNSAAYDGNITADGSGNITAIGQITFLPSQAVLKISSGSAILDAHLGTDLILNAPNTGGGHKMKFQVGGTTVVSIDSTGHILYAGSAPAFSSNP